MVRSHWLRVCAARLVALFRLAFTPAPGLPSLSLAAQRNSQAYSTKDTPQTLCVRDILPVHGFRFCFTPLAGVLFTFPSRYYALSVAVRIQPWIVVDPDSGWVPRAPPYSGTASWRRIRSAYGAVTLSGPAVRPVPLCLGLITPRVIPMRPYNPALGGLGSSLFARRYSGNLS